MTRPFGGIEPFYSEHIHTARIAHTCTECAGTVPPRAKYTKVTHRLVKRGPIATFDICEACLAWGQALHNAPGGFWELGSLWFCIATYCRDFLGYDPERQR
jgi:hypothetical protein